MFDTHYVTERTEAKNVNIKEYKAPTDASIKLYEEFIEKAKLALVDSFRVNSNAINFDIAIFEDHLWMGKKAYYKININGNEITNTVDIFDRPYMRDSDRYVVAQVVLKNIVKDIVSQFSHKISFELRKNF